MQELESLLDDDEDMADMYLTRRAKAEERRHKFLEAAKQSAAEGGTLPLTVPSHRRHRLLWGCMQAY